eukprot:304146-Rhodomonas_salina.1
MPTTVPSSGSSRHIEVVARSVALAQTARIRRDRSTARRVQVDMRRVRQSNFCESAASDPAPDGRLISIEDQAPPCATILHPETPGTRPDSGELPPGCAVGIPVPMGTPVSTTDMDDRSRDIAILRSIQADNYKFIRHMITTGWEPRNPNSCSFVLTKMENGLK